MGCLKDMNRFFLYLIKSLLFLAIIPCSAQEQFFRKVYEVKTGSYVEVKALFSSLPTSGYAPVRVTIANRTAVPASLSFDFTSTVNSIYYSSNGHLEMKSSFGASAAAGTVSTTDLLVPVAAMVKSNSSYGQGSQSLSVTMVGVSNDSYTQSSTLSDKFPNILLSEVLYTPNASSLDAATNAHIGSGSYSSGNLKFAGKFIPSEMPDDWRGYSGYDRIIMTDTDWTSMTPGARAAVLQWNRSGGLLRICLTNPANTFTTLGIDKTNDGGKALTRSMGIVRLVPLGAGSSLDAKKLVKEMTSKPSDSWQYQSYANDYSGIWGLQNAMGQKTFHFFLFILVLIGFAVLVAPVNLFVFAKSDRRHKLFITTPIISIGASLAMIALIFLQDGLGGKGMRVQLMEVRNDGSDNNSYLVQEQISRTGVLLSGRFQMSESCVISPVPLNPSQWVRLSNDSTNDQNYSLQANDKGMLVNGDWFQSRSEQAQVLKAVIPSRARIEAVANSASPAFLSYFEYPLTQFFYVADDGKFWTADNIAAGTNFTCRESSEAEYATFIKNSASLFGKGNGEKLESLSKRSHHFVATSSSAPMLETFSSINWTESTSVITGSIAQETQP
jgi:hypothetical protein